MDDVGEKADWCFDSGPVKPSVNPGIAKRSTLAWLVSYRCRSSSLAALILAS